MSIKRHFDSEMADLQQMVGDMSRAVLAMMDRCMAMMRRYDQQVLAEIDGLEQSVNRWQMKIDDLAWKIIALYQPTASDLRVLLGSIKLASDLERVGDEIIALCRRATTVSGCEWHEPPSHLLDMQVMARSLLKDGLQAVSMLDEGLAESIMPADDAIDHEFEALFQMVKDAIKATPAHTDALLEYLSMGRSLERIADHATNLAEITIFIKKGQDVRHHRMPLN